jgi:UDP-glucose 4-epimerase
MTADFRSPETNKTLVFGANGFLGSVICKKLSLTGHSVVGVVRKGVSRKDSFENPGFEIIETSPELWPDLIRSFKPNHVVCAQWSGVQKNLRGDFELQRSNLRPIIDLAEVANSLSIKSFIAIGSQAESQPSSEFIMEKMYTTGNTAYGKAKIELLGELETVFVDSKCRFVWARVFSVYGPSDKSDSILMQLCNSELLGSQLSVKNPNVLWSFLYEDDFASAVKRILEETSVSGVINVAEPRLVKVQHIVDTWHQFPNSSPDECLDDNAHDGFFPVVGKLKSIGWKPEVSLEDGINSTREAYRRRLLSS